MKRLEDRRFLTGSGQFVDDLKAADALHLWVVRSPHAHAAIERIETDAARGAPGVAGVFTSADLAGLGPLPCVARPKTVGLLIVPPRHALAVERVRHVGDPVAFVVAETLEAARDAAELIEVDYRVLPSVVDGRAALAAGAAAVWDEVPDNLAFTFRAGDAAATAEAMGRAAHVSSIALVNNRIVVAPIEPRAGIARYEAGTDTMRLTLTGQGVQGIRRELAEDVFRVPLERIQLRAPDVGGGFGMKNFLYPEWVLLLWAARRLGRAVKWVAERGEDFLSDTQGRDASTRARLALDAEGKFLALEVETVANLGAYLSSYGPGIATNMTAMGGVYEIPTMAAEVRGAFTNTVPVDAYRGAGKPEANYLIERLIELAARETGRDAVLLRKRNIVASFPYRNAAGTLIDDGRFAANLEAATARADYAGFAERRAAAAAAGRLRGIGVGCYLETARGAVDENAAIRFAGDGAVELLLGTQSNGQGHETSFPEIAAELLGLSVKKFRLVQADTERVPEGNGHGGARSMHMGGTALVHAAEEVIGKGTRIAAHLLQAGPEEIRFTAGRFHRAGDDAGGIDLLALATAARDAANLPAGMKPGIDGFARNHCETFTFPSGCHVAEVEVDPETGRVALLRYVSVDDFGRLINPMITAGQLQGGVAQGIGQAMLERTVYEEESGQLLSASLLDYALPRSDDLPEFETVLAGLPSKANPLGVKGSGQAGCMAAPQTVMAAILDALAPLGVRHLEMPATSEQVWRAIRARGSAPGPGWGLRPQTPIRLK